ncbi:hypothetical protein ACFQ34_31415 [Pseudonocardia benzenivorans]|uniref:Uncharacterized protein n=3 Tax=Pseudonocardia TaxID=1847 RepID=F4CQW7_PSEUX|nr:hypothetical protein [Pseudonocardia dioxanivorans]AEA23666.1 hypothetical protein Psed_1427 [Pseudonocardia dioxanivorans CB1190]
MNIVTKSVAVVLTAAALGGLGAGVASAATPTDTPAAVSRAAVASQVGARQNVTYLVSDASTHYQLVLTGISDPTNADNTWAGVPKVGQVLVADDLNIPFALNVAGKTATQGTLTFRVIDQNTGEQGDFTATLAWYDDGTPNGKTVITLPNGQSSINPTPGSTVLEAANGLELVNAQH